MLWLSFFVQLLDKCACIASHAKVAHSVPQAAAAPAASQHARSKSCPVASCKKAIATLVVAGTPFVLHRTPACKLHLAAFFHCKPLGIFAGSQRSHGFSAEGTRGGGSSEKTKSRSRREGGVTSLTGQRIPRLQSHHSAAAHMRPRPPAARRSS